MVMVAIAVATATLTSQRSTTRHASQFAPSARTDACRAIVTAVFYPPASGRGGAEVVAPRANSGLSQVQHLVFGQNVSTGSFSPRQT